MSAVLRLSRMTVAEFQDWVPLERADHRWNLVDGEPVCMAPASENHARIVGQATFLLADHLRTHRPGCSVLGAPGVIPRVRAGMNERIPDLAVTCVPSSGGKVVTDPVLVIEILSPSNEAQTRSNVWAYASLPSVLEILLLGSVKVEAELLRRTADGSWPEQPAIIGPEAVLELASLGFRTPLRELYRTTNLV